MCSQKAFCGMNALIGACMSKLRGNSGQKVIFCYAEGCEGSWEAFCLDFDLAVQGQSFESVRLKLDDAIHVYLASIATLPQDDRRRLLNRRAPLSLWLTPFLHLLRAAFTRRDDRLRHEFTLPSPATAVA
jgi:hypothetical protein